MTTLNKELRRALISAGAPEPEAEAAAESVAAYETRFASADMRMERIEGRLNLVTWMVGFNLAATMALVFKLFG